MKEEVPAGLQPIRERIGSQTCQEELDPVGTSALRTREPLQLGCPRTLNTVKRANRADQLRIARPTAIFAVRRANLRS